MRTYSPIRSTGRTRGPSFPDAATTFTQAERDALAQQGIFRKDGEIILNETGPVENYRQPYVDQWLVALEKQFSNWGKLEAIYTRRANKDMVALVDREPGHQLHPVRQGPGLRRFR